VEAQVEGIVNPQWKHSLHFLAKVI